MMISTNTTYDLIYHELTIDDMMILEHIDLERRASCPLLRARLNSGGSYIALGGTRPDGSRDQQNIESQSTSGHDAYVYGSSLHHP